MSRKDPRRAIAVALPREALRLVRQRQAQSRGRRLMDTLRVMLTEALAQHPAPRRPFSGPQPTASSLRLLQLPPAQRVSLAALSQTTGVAEDVLICELILGRAPPDAPIPNPSPCPADPSAKGTKPCVPPLPSRP